MQGYDMIPELKTCSLEKAKVILANKEEMAAHWGSKLPELAAGKDTSCRIERSAKGFWGSIELPALPKVTAISFLFYWDKKVLILAGEKELLLTFLHRLSGVQEREEVFLSLLYTMLSPYFSALARLEQNLTALEDGVLAGEWSKFNHKMSKYRKELRQASRCFLQLEEGCDLLQEEIPEQAAGQRWLQLLSHRVNRLHQETVTLREYATQVREIEQSQMDRRQNDIMRILTVVTTLFLPLTLIVGWYGMNFVQMPELSSPYGYPAVIFVSIAVVIICLVIFWKKGFFSDGEGK
ncbi:MAG TPA: cobalt transporter [Firmicutes bacterium]|nr:cobalt transporter [Bacillota bacterium]